MNTRSSSYTGRSARCMESAFGPYARGPIHAPKEPLHPADKVVLIASGCAFAGLVVIAAIGWFA